MSINLVRYEGHTITPKIDARLSHKVHTKDAIYEGCTVSIIATNQLHITSGNGIIQGGEFEIVEQDLLVALPTDVTTYGVGYGLIYIRINLSDLTTPIELKSVIYRSFNSDPFHYNLTQDSDLYGNNGVWEIPICLYSANLTSVTLIQQNKSAYTSYDGQMIEYNQDIFETSEKNIAPLFEIGSSLAVGVRRIYEGVLYELIYNYNGAIILSWNPPHWQSIDVDSVLTEISNTIGLLSTLTTTVKTSIVNAINSLVTAINSITTSIGTLSSLTTTDKSSVVNAINGLILTYSPTVSATNGYITVPSNQAVYSVQNSSATTSNDAVTSWQRTSATQIYYNKTGTASTTLTIVYKP